MTQSTNPQNTKKVLVAAAVDHLCTLFESEPIVIEGRPVVTEFEEQDPQTPNVQFQTLVFVTENLGGEVLPRAANRAPAFGRRQFAREAEVGQFGLEVAPEQNVLGLDIAVQHILPVERPDAPTNFLENERDLRVREGPFLAQVLEERAPGGVLEQQVHVAVLAVHMVQRDQVGVPHCALDLDLLLQIFQLARFQLASGDLVKLTDLRANLARVAGSCTRDTFEEKPAPRRGSRVWNWLSAG